MVRRNGITLVTLESIVDNQSSTSITVITVEIIAFINIVIVPSLTIDFNALCEWVSGDVVVTVEMSWVRVT